jgi:capsular polysaccharide biosynthesis protein
LIELSCEALTAGDVYRALWRHKALIIVLTAVFVAATWYLVAQESRKYDASTLVRVVERGPDAGDASGALLAAQTAAQTYAKLINSGALKPEMRSLLATCSRPLPQPITGGQASTGQSAARARSIKELRSTCKALGGAATSRSARRRLSEVGVSASQVESLDLLSITARSQNKVRAMVGANAAAFALRGFIRKAGSGSERIVVAKAAVLPSSPASRQLALKVVLALMVGLLFNGALALLLELFRDRLPETEELGRALGQPVLATIPSLRLNRVERLVATRPDERPITVREETDERIPEGHEHPG